MEEKQSIWKIVGMQRDIAVSSFNTQFSYENMNIRITATEHNTSLAVSNERGNLEKTALLYEITKETPENPEEWERTSSVTLKGIIIGQAIVGDYLVIFTTCPEHTEKIGTITETIPKTDYIYRLYYKGEKLYADQLIGTDLNFDYKCPLETITFYENENIQKVYWLDGINQPRVINIVAPLKTILNWTNESFDFVREIDLHEHITITKNNAVGMFSAGIIQYAFTYYSLYGQESNIFNSSALNYISFKDRGGSPEDKCSNSFKIEITNPDTRFDYLRIYAIERTSLDATPLCRQVVDLSIPKDGSTISYIDTGTTGGDIDPTLLLYVGGEDCSFGTFTHKDNTLFLGDSTLKRQVVSEELKQQIISEVVNNKIHINYYTDTAANEIKDTLDETPYSYSSQLKYNSQQITTFKYGETYRIGVQFQYKTGKWTEPVWLTDKENNILPKIYRDTSSGFNDIIYTPTFINVSFTSQGSSALINFLKEAGYVRARGVIVYPTINDRTCLCQGILEPTVFNVKDRAENGPFAQSSWFSRPNAGYDTNQTWGEILKRIDSSIKHNEISLPIQDSQQQDIPYLNSVFNGIEEDGKDYQHNYNTGNTYLHQGKDTPIGALNQINFNIDYSNSSGQFFDTINSGKWAEFRHNSPIPSNVEPNAEIQCIYNPPINSYVDVFSATSIENIVKIKTLQKEWIDQHSEYYYIDQSIFTMHSPELEFDDTFLNLDLSNAKLRIIGIVPITAQSGDIDIQTSSSAQLFAVDTSAEVSTPTIAHGFYKEECKINNISIRGWKQLLSMPFWMDELYANISYKNPNKLHTGFVVYPWHRNGSLNNQALANEEGNRTALLEQKKMINVHYSAYTNYINTPWYAYQEDSTINTGISGVTLFNSTEMQLVKIPAPLNSGLDDLVYYGNIDKVLTVGIEGSYGRYYDGTDSSRFIELEKKDGYPIIIASTKDKIPLGTNNLASIYNHRYTELFNKYIIDNLFGFGIDFRTTDPVRIKYKSTPHAVISLNYTQDNKQRILPTTFDALDNTIAANLIDEYIPLLNNNFINGGNSNIPFWTNIWREGTQEGTVYKIWRGVSQDALYIKDRDNRNQPLTSRFGYLWLGELYNDNIENRFGGNTKEAIENNLWIPCGEPVEIEDSGFNLKYTEGDTFIQRYDCMKTYPFTLEDQNLVTDIVSFMCETRINIDGRYDRNRGQLHNFSLTPQNFNLLNPIYSQRNNFFNYRTLDADRFGLSIFKNTITWTKTKSAGALIDTWTNITMANTLDLDGDKGTIRALRRFNNSIIAFQDKAIAHILYNEKAQIATSIGVPVELADSGKVEGKQYLTNQIGCINKWSIVETPRGVYFADDINKDIYLYNGQFGNLSQEKGFTSFFHNKLNGTIWNPIDFTNFVTYYDSINSMVYFINKDYCLGFDETMGQFISFYSYENTPYFNLLNYNGFLFRIGYERATNNYNTHLWGYRDGIYNIFFYKYKPFYITLIANEGPTIDKVFTNLEFRSDSWDPNNKVLDTTFDTLDVWNEYQYGHIDLIDKTRKTSSLKRKFRVWRTDFPRACYGDFTQLLNDKELGELGNIIDFKTAPTTVDNFKQTRDRIRNTWSFIKLSMNTLNYNKTILHDVIVKYLQ